MLPSTYWNHVLILNDNAMPISYLYIPNIFLGSILVWSWWKSGKILIVPKKLYEGVKDLQSDK